MNALPQEIVELIAYLANHDTRIQLLTVSRPFQIAVERIYWGDCLSLPGKDMDKSLAIYHGPRARFLRFINTIVQFPVLRHTEETPLRCRETTDETRTNNELITDQIFGLFTALRKLAIRELPHNQPSGICMHIQTPYQRDNIKLECEHRRYHSWRLCLLNPQTLPEVSSIRTLIIGEPQRRWTNDSCRRERPLDLGMVAHLISKLPNLEVLNCAYLNERFPKPYEDAVIRHFTRPWEGPWRDSRHAFGNAIMETASTLPSRMHSARFYFGEDDQLGPSMDQSVALPNLVKPMSYDPLSSALRMVSQQLTKFDIRVCADSNLFWPLPQEEIATSPSWPNLKRLRVEFRPSSPSGKWFFEGPRGEGRDAVGYEITEEHYPPVEETQPDEEWDEIWAWESGRYENTVPDVFRTEPIDETLEPFLEAFAKALTNMPELEVANLFTYLGWCPGGDREEEYSDREINTKYRWGVRYLAAGDTAPRLEWQVGDWRPSIALQKRFKDLALYRGDGKQLQEQWIDF